jgi:hypothetical protein
MTIYSNEVRKQVLLQRINYGNNKEYSSISYMSRTFKIPETTIKICVLENPRQ